MKYPAPRKKKLQTPTHNIKNTQKNAFRTQNTMQNSVKQHPRTDKYNKSGIYRIKYLDCPLKYIGQSGRAFHARQVEHIQAIRKHDSNSGSSNHILNTRHKYGTVADTMDIIRKHRKGKRLNTLKNTTYTRSAKINCK
jgi:hypothetical protein